MATLTAGSSGTTRGYSDGSFFAAIGSLSPATIGGVTASAMVTDTGTANVVSVLTGAGTAATMAALNLEINGTSYGLGTVTDYGSFVGTDYSTPSFVFVDTSVYTVDLVGPPAYAGPTYAAVGSPAASVNATSVSVTGVRGVGRRMFIAVMTANEAIATPSGWTAFVADSGTPERNTPGAAGGVRLVLWWKDSDGTETNVTVADSGAVPWTPGE